MSMMLDLSPPGVYLLVVFFTAVLLLLYYRTTTGSFELDRVDRVTLLFSSVVWSLGLFALMCVLFMQERDYD